MLQRHPDLRVIKKSQRVKEMEKKRRVTGSKIKTRKKPVIVNNNGNDNIVTSSLRDLTTNCSVWTSIRTSSEQMDCKKALGRPHENADIDTIQMIRSNYY